LAKSAAGPSKGSPESHDAGGLPEPLQSRSQLLLARLTLLVLHTGHPWVEPPPSSPKSPTPPLLLLPLPPLPLPPLPPPLLLANPVPCVPEPLQEKAAAATTEARQASVEVRMLMFQSYAGDPSRLNLAPRLFREPLRAQF